MSNEEDHPIQTMVIRWISALAPTVVSIASLVFSIFAKVGVDNVRESNEEAYRNIENRIETVINNQQSVDVIQARANDVLIKTSDNKWIVVPMIQSSDISFSSQIYEKQYKKSESNLPREDINNTNLDDWTSRDSFTYTIPYLTINQDKMISLRPYIDSIKVVFKMFNADKVTFKDYFVEIFQKGKNYPYLNVFEDITPNYQFVTKEINDGIEDIKISINIDFNVSNDKFTIPYYYDNWMDIKQDYKI